MKLNKPSDFTVANEVISYAIERTIISCSLFVIKKKKKLQAFNLCSSWSGLDLLGRDHNLHSSCSLVDHPAQVDEPGW